MSENKIVKDVPYIVHEGAMARMERTIARLWVLCIILVVLLLGTNIAWVIYESQYTNIVETTIEATQSTEEGGDNIIAGGDVNG